MRVFHEQVNDPGKGSTRKRFRLATERGKALLIFEEENALGPFAWREAQRFQLDATFKAAVVGIFAVNEEGG